MSAWLSNAESRQNSESSEQTGKGDKSLWVAYLWALFLGWAGGHRFYLGQYLMGTVYLFSFGGFAIAWLIDLLALPWIVAKANRNRTARISAEDILIDESEIIPDPSLNPLSSALAPWRWFKYFFMLSMMVVVPYTYYTFFGDLFFTFILILLYFVVVYNKEIAGVVARDDFWLWNIPGLRSRLLIVVNGFARLRRYYASRRPSGWIFSFFSLFLIPFSSEIRKEWKLFQGLLAFGMIFMIFQFASWGWEFFTVYRPELSLINLLVDIKLLIFLVSAAITLIMVIPLIRTLTYVELAGDINKARVLVVLATVGAMLMPFTSTTEVYSYEDYQRLRLRIGKVPTFRQKLDKAAQVFLHNHFRPQSFSFPVTDNGEKSSTYRLQRSQLYLHTSIELTRKFRQDVVQQKIVHRSEVNGFRVLAFRVNRTATGMQYGLLLYAGHDEKDVHWHRLITWQNLVPLRALTTPNEVSAMYRIMLERMKKMGKGDQLSPDFKG